MVLSCVLRRACNFGFEKRCSNEITPEIREEYRLRIKKTGKIAYSMVEVLPLLFAALGSPTNEEVQDEAKLNLQGYTIVVGTLLGPSGGRDTNTGRVN